MMKALEDAFYVTRRRKIFTKPFSNTQKRGGFLAFKRLWFNNHQEVTDPRRFVDEFFEAILKTKDFLELSLEEKKQFLFLNDWLMNLQNRYMPWAIQYKSTEEWEELAKAAGFQKIESHFIGAMEKRKRKQGMTAFLTFSLREKK